MMPSIVIQPKCSATGPKVPLLPGPVVEKPWAGKPGWSHPVAVDTSSRQLDRRLGRRNGISSYGGGVTRTADLDNPRPPDDKDVFVPPSRAAWRDWLATNHERQQGLWVVYRKKSSSLEGPLYEDLVEEALCFGWIDSLTRRVDECRMIQWFSPRRRGGIWSSVNKDRIERLERGGQMTEAGRATIERAKADGSWSQNDEVEGLIVPDDLAAALVAAPAAKATYEGLADSVKKQLLWSVYSAKRPETRAKRIEAMIRTMS